ncbi:MAG: carboxylesterase family protein, partial [Acetobacteraceae bacterium]
MIAVTHTGQVRGRRDADTWAFLGIPYAAPPTDRLRWCSPRPAQAWTGVRDAVAFGAAPVQTLGGSAAWLYDTAEPQSEDCLTLNVWT